MRPLVAAQDFAALALKMIPSTTTTASSLLREAGTPITGTDPSFTATTTPGVVDAQAYETAIPTGLVLASFVLMLAATAVGCYSVKANSTAWENPPPYPSDAEAAAAASDASPDGKKSKKVKLAKPLALPWVLRNPRWLGLLAAAFILDLYVYFSLFEFIIAGTWNKQFGYSPSYFLFACSVALFQARPYTALLSSRKTRKIGGGYYRDSSPSSFDIWRGVINTLLVLLVFCLAIKKATLTGNASFTGVRTVVQLNSTYKYDEFADALFVKPNYLYNRVAVSTSDGYSDIFTGPLWACEDYSYAPLVSNSTFNATSTTTFICQIRQPGFSTFLDAWSVIKFIALCIVFGGFIYSLDGDGEALGVLMFNLPMLVLAFVELIAVFARSVASPAIYLELAWCPTTDFHYCQIMELGVLYPYSLRQTSLWASTLGAYPIDKIAGYGAITVI
ncbi:hypothetical protein DFJ73DRAFT_785507 [Zopfochytrium polystomum]|nr:hypothetical protein DFJ73DRAFT_785507 [Zopfochytrium polystomum]